MDQKKLHKTIETIAQKQFESDEQMLISVLNEIIDNEQIEVNGGRIWKLNSYKKNYRLMYQTGDMESINPEFEVKIKDYPIFDQIARSRTILGNETNSVLRKKGIFKYSASGVGDRIKIDGKPYYEYLLALNSEELDEALKLNLSIISTALTSQIKQRKYSARAHLLTAGLDKARELQKSILPEHEKRFHNYELFGVTDPAEIVGGDFFDYLPVGEDNDRLGIVVGDAASKGVSAAAEAMYISGAIRMASGFEIKIVSLMKKMNKLVNKIFSDDKFSSLFYGELSSDKSGLFLYANAGHNPPLFVKAGTGEVKLLNPTGPVLGPAPMAKYDIQSEYFEKGDVMLIYSDGLTDSADSSFEAFGEERLQELFVSVKHLSAKEIAYSILNEVIIFSKNGMYSDDKTLVVIKRVN